MTAILLLVMCLSPPNPTDNNANPVCCLRAVLDGLIWSGGGCCCVCGLGRGLVVDLVVALVTGC